MLMASGHPAHTGQGSSLGGVSRQPTADLLEKPEGGRAELSPAALPSLWVDSCLPTLSLCSPL